MFRKLAASSCLLSIFLAGCGSTPLPGPFTPPPAVTPVAVAPSTAIQHVVVIFGENISFDHYFGTYPQAANNGGTPFTAATGTPTPNNYISNPNLLTTNPNLASGNGNSAANPFRLGPDQAGTGDQDHNYGPEQAAFDNGKMDLFPFSVGTADGTALTNETAAPGIANTTALTMAYFDGNTVTGMWNYAQHYSLNDHSFGTTFGASTQGAINLASGQTNGAIVTLPGAASGTVADGAGGLTLIGDEDPANDVCSSSTATVQMTGKNIGDLLNAGSVSWGFFQGGFDLTKTNSNFTNTSGIPVIASGSGCLANENTGSRATGAVYIPGHPLKADYIPHHEPFQYYTSTANPMHNRPTPGIAIGATDAAGANHQYDTADFNAALTAATPTMPAVTFLKAPGYQDGHGGYSDPLDEQFFVVNEINAIEASPFWNTTAIILAYDDSDGWYDHLNNVINGSQSLQDVTGGICAVAPTLLGVTSTTPVLGRCGYGPRLPLLVISPWAKANFIDSTVTDQSSITRFIEDIFLSSKRIGGGSSDTVAGSIMNMFNFTTLNGALPNPTPLYLSPTTGAVCSPATGPCK
jgi:phospholipase C